jgi:hypothetical protein
VRGDSHPYLSSDEIEATKGMDKNYMFPELNLFPQYFDPEGKRLVPRPPCDGASTFAAYPQYNLWGANSVHHKRECCKLGEEWWNEEDQECQVKPGLPPCIG